MRPSDPQPSPRSNISRRPTKEPVLFEVPIMKLVLQTNSEVQ
jgi:hypothetical protein